MAVRSEASHKAILEATMELLDPDSGEGISVQKLSIERIARVAGVSKTTIYRWWPSKVAVVIDSFVASHIARTPVRDDLPGLEALREHMGALVETYATHEGRLISQLIAECQHDQSAMKEFKERFWHNRRAAAVSIIRRAQEEGDIWSELDSVGVADLIYAPIYFRLLFQSGPLERAWSDRVLDIALTGLTPREAA
ncbi:MAG TPA: TetR/AcrR family transcriptional regulator [Enteractinococcus helveticum]|uniref:TetR/AcrR family transcriptional regulator n=1 Tax=Enteractinococcus helveticum TaxID=1837282 RepID=A0A921FP78_9MICC|nr:TetR/AcrR family transcriptional regulator [Enteractinococcus helveticum]HJF15694.1 TetR/AcrR family transcriptional regulator [Enteractinococcus helveticum]